jgi:hypothetical protein
MAAEAVADWIAPLVSAEPVEAVPPADPASWREKLWTVPSEVRIGRNELSEALGRPVSWIYRHTSVKAGLPMLPHRKLDGELVFVVGEVRAWLLDHEEVLRSGRVEGPARGGLRAVPGGFREAS